MGNIEFDEPTGRKINSENQKGLVWFLMKHRIAKSKKSANIILICISIFFFTASLVIYLSFK